jgi:hypothetical protein
MRLKGGSVRVEAVAYLILLLVGGWLRLSDLGWPPLSDTEARHALAASALSGNPSPFDPNLGNPPPGVSYRVGTAGLIQLFGSSDAMARVLPALAGLALCFLPLLARRRLGAGGALALTALLSLSPVLVTVSRQAGSTSLACLGLVGFLVALIGRDPSATGTRRATWAAAFAALALTSGSAWVQGVVGLALGVGLLALRQTRRARSVYLSIRSSFSLRELVVGLILVLGIATGLGSYPSGAADTFESLGSWLSGWSAPASMPVLSEILVIPAYDPLLMVFGCIGAAIAFRRKDELGVAAVFWSLGGLILAAVYPGRSSLDLAWVAVPVAYLASRGLLFLIGVLLSEQAWPRVAGMTGAYVALAAFVYLQLAAYASDLGLDLPVLEPNVRLVIVIIGILVLVALVLLFGTGWSWSASGSAFAAAIFLVLSAVSIGSIVRLNFGSSAAEAGQLWEPRVSAVGLRELRFTLDFLSEAYLDDPGGLTLVVDGSVPPSLAWTVRRFEEAPVSAGGEAPPVVLAPSEAEPALRADYLGQLLAIAETNNWEGTFPPDVVSWWVLHRSPIRLDDWVMLVRADVATQGGLTALGNETNP